MVCGHPTVDLRVLAWQRAAAGLQQLRRDAVDDLFFIESVTDKTVDAVGHVERVLAFACSRCERSFASQKALESPCRMKHGDRLDIRRYVRNAVCPCCGTDFRDRLRYISHLSDRRRPSCALWVKSSVRPMPDSDLAKLDEVDRKLRTEAQRRGHTCHIAVVPARRQDGRIIGRVSS